MLARNGAGRTLHGLPSVANVEELLRVENLLRLWFRSQSAIRFRTKMGYLTIVNYLWATLLAVEIFGQESWSVRKTLWDASCTAFRDLPGRSSLIIIDRKSEQNVH